MTLAIAGFSYVGQVVADPAYHDRTRRTVDEVLARPEFADLGERTSWQQWLAERLQGFISSIGNLFEGLPTWLLWVIVIWMVLVLLAIFAHVVWVLIQTMGLGGAAGRRDVPTVHEGQLLGVQRLELDSVWREGRHLLETGQSRAAIQHFYVAALLGLDERGLLRFDPSKTNGQCLRELAHVPQVRHRFGRLTALFESIVYGGRPSSPESARAMQQAAEVICHGSTSHSKQ